MRFDLPLAEGARPRISFSARGPPEGAKAVTIDVGGKPVQATATGDQTLHFKAESLPPEYRRSPTALADAIGSGDASRLPGRLREAPAGGTVRVDGPRSPLYREIDAHLSAGRTGDVAGAVARDPVAGKEALAAIRAERCSSADAYLARGQHAEALAVLEPLQALHGPRPPPSLATRIALARIAHGRASEAAQLVRRTPGAERNVRGLHLEIGRRLRGAVGPAEREALHDVAGLARRDLGAKGAKSGTLTLNVERPPPNKPIGSQLTTERPLTTDPVDIAALAKERQPLLYIEDAPGLNNRDYTGSLPETVKSLIAGGEAELRALHEGRLVAREAPDLLATRNGASRHFRADGPLVTEPQTMSGFRPGEGAWPSYPYRTHGRECDAAVDPGCDEDEPESSLPPAAPPRTVYLLRLKGKP